MSDSNSRAASKRAATIAGAALGLGALATLIGVVAVNAWPQDEDSAQEDFCASVDTLATSVQDYHSLDLSTATTDEIRDASEAVDEAYDDMVDEGSEWVNAWDNELTNAYWNLYYAVEALPDDNTVSENVEELEPFLSEFPQAFEETFDGTCATA